MHCKILVLSTAIASLHLPGNLSEAESAVTPQNRGTSRKNRASALEAGVFRRDREHIATPRGVGIFAEICIAAPPKRASFGAARGCCVTAHCKTRSFVNGLARHSDPRSASRRLFLSTRACLGTDRECDSGPIDAGLPFCRPENIIRRSFWRQHAGGCTWFVLFSSCSLVLELIKAIVRRSLITHSVRQRG